MSPKQFFDLVVQMRQKQRDYAKSKDGTALRYARDLERRVDEEIKRAQLVLREQQQPRLTL